MLSLYNINVFFIGKPKSRPCTEFLEIGFQQDSAFGFLVYGKKLGKEVLYKGREICIKIGVKGREYLSFVI